LLFIAIESYCQADVSNVKLYEKNELHIKSDAKFDLFSFARFIIRNKKRKRTGEIFAKIYKELIKLIGNIQQDTGSLWLQII